MGPVGDFLEINVDVFLVNISRGINILHLHSSYIGDHTNFYKVG